MKNSKHIAIGLICFLMFAIFNCNADDTAGITNKVYEKKDSNGKVIYRLEKIYRDGSEIMMISSETNAQGNLVVAARSYLVGGDLLMTESDENRDGFFETIAIYRPPNDEMEVFIRQPDGSVKPASTKILEAYKKKTAEISKFWDDFKRVAKNKDS